MPRSIRRCGWGGHSGRPRPYNALSDEGARHGAGRPCLGLRPAHRSAEGQKPTMNPDPTRPEPDDDATAAGSDPDLVDAIALEAVTSAAVPTPEPAAAGDGADPMIGRHLGAYRLVSRIGGNDRVRFYLAERVGSFEQRAAVKVVEPAMGGEAIVRRFRATSRIHAALSGHPNLAGLLDAGT